MTRPPDASVLSNRETGRWRVLVTAWRDGAFMTEDVTFVRGVPTTVGQVGWTDPFGPSTASLSFPSVSPMEPRGAASNDLWWLRHDTDVDIVYEVTDPATIAALVSVGMPTRIVWEGFIESMSLASADVGDTVSVECSGAMLAIDRRVAQQVTFSRPHTYEWIIARHFSWADELHPTRLAPLRIEWPHGWERVYKPDDNLPPYLVPAQVADGDYWTGMTAREFGRWDPVLSSAVQGLLSVMFTDDGQFTLMLDEGRAPVIRHRPRLTEDRYDTLLVDPTWPGVKYSFECDASQSAQAIFGESRSSISGTVYRGLRFSTDGSSSAFDPFAQHASVDPSSPMSDPTVMRRELYINFNDGLQPVEAMEKARLHMRNNAAPGKVGTIELSSLDPAMLGPDGMLVPFPAPMIRAGMTIRMTGLDGMPRGELFSISAAEYDSGSNTATLTVDTRFRDYMTVREVMERGRDALRPWHMMTVGKYNLNIPDAMLPWSYEQGSGYIPRQSSEGFWEGAAPWLQYPWVEHTTARPPKHATWGRCYIKVPAIAKATGPVDSRTYWNKPDVAAKSNPCEVLLAQAGEIALLQIAAYDADGNVKKVPFHVSIWASNNASASSAPKLYIKDAPKTYTSRYIDADGVIKTVVYRDGDPYPYFKNAWEQFNTAGDMTTESSQMPAQDGLLVGYGNYWEKAGYWPGTGRGDFTDADGYDDPAALDTVKPTGLLVDETGFSFDMSQYENFLLSANGTNTLLEHANCTVLVFCESETDTYFLGRLFRKEPGGG